MVKGSAVPRKLVQPDAHAEVAAQIEAMIKREKLWGRRLLAERALAEQLKVNRWTVQRALGELEARGLIERRHGSGTRVAERSSRERAAPAVARLALVAARQGGLTSDWTWAGELLHGVLAAAPRLRASCETFLLDRPEDVGRLRDAREMRRFDGFIVVSEDDRGLLSGLLDLRRGPVVLLDHYVRDLPVVGVVDGSFEGMRAVARHLLGLGHRRIAFLDCCDRAASNPEKFAGYRTALEAAGAFDESLVLIPPSNQEGEIEQFVSADLGRLLDRPDPPTAVLGFDDSRALMAWRALEARGLKVGADVSLAGHGDGAFRRGLSGRLTSCRINLRQMSREALRAALAGRVSSESRTIIVPNRLVVRESTRPAPLA
jgi:LacI family transcriptional regulator